MQGFPQDNVLGQTGVDQDNITPEMLQQKAVMDERNRIINKFMTGVQSVGMVDATTNRGILNGLLADNIDIIVGCATFKNISKRISSARDIGLDSIIVSCEEIEEIEYQMKGNEISSGSWISVLTTLQYGVIRKDNGEVIVLW